jgi:uncharacterized OsmC-like protein
MERIKEQPEADGKEIRTASSNGPHPPGLFPASAGACATCGHATPHKKHPNTGCRCVLAELN